MNLLNKLTIKNLKLNKKRTIVTIIGIILSTALITGVATLVTSFKETIINDKRKSTGYYHYEFEDVPIEDLKYITNNRNVKQYYFTKNIGYALLNNSANEYKPYVYIIGFSRDAIENLNINLKEGKMPENENQIVVSNHMITNGGLQYKIGDKIKLDIGERVTSENGIEYELNQNNPYIDEEIFKSSYIKEYEIVGIIERPDYNLEEYSAPGYTVITYLEENISTNSVNVYTVYKNLQKHIETTAQILDISEENMKDLAKYGTSDEIQKLKYNYNANESLIKWENLEFSNSTVAMLYSVSSLIILIIIFTSVFCIRNSFEISITERIKQYGMLASIGATSKQIKKDVLYEGLILGAIGIPLGILSGLFAIFILLKVIQGILASAIEITFVFKTSFASIIISILLCSITIYLSARKSAKKASKVSPIEAIRSNQDIKIKEGKNSLKTPKIIKKIFGIGGIIAYKNLKRNKKKYRTTVISIVTSVAIFIAMTSFFTYAFKSNDIYNTKRSYNLIVYETNQIDLVDDNYNKLKQIANIDGIEDYTILMSNTIFIPKAELQNHYSEKNKKITKAIEELESELYEEEEDSSNDTSEELSYITIYALQQQEYQKFIEQTGLKYDECKDKAILIDNMKNYVTIDEKSSYVLYRLYDYKKGDKIDATIKLSQIENESESENINIDKTITIEIAGLTDERPMGLENVYSSNGFIIVSEEFFEKNDIETKQVEMFINAKDADQIEEYINKNYPNDFYVNNIEKSIREQNAVWLVIAIFLYGFIIVISLIGVTNIFNTITTNMTLRSKEFANLKSIGMTKKEFNKMIRLESFFYCVKSLIFGIIIGSILSFLLYKAFAEGIDMGYIYPIQGVIISIIAVALLITTIMKYTLNKINKQNIIETIRKDNI